MWNAIALSQIVRLCQRLLCHSAVIQCWLSPWWLTQQYTYSLMHIILMFPCSRFGISCKICLYRKAYSFTNKKSSLSTAYWVIWLTRIIDQQRRHQSHCGGKCCEIGHVVPRQSRHHGWYEILDVIHGGRLFTGDQFVHVRRRRQVQMQSQ